MRHPVLEALAARFYGSGKAPVQQVSSPPQEVAKAPVVHVPDDEAD